MEKLIINELVNDIIKLISLSASKKITYLMPETVTDSHIYSLFEKIFKPSNIKKEVLEKINYAMFNNIAFICAEIMSYNDLMIIKKIKSYFPQIPILVLLDSDKYKDVDYIYELGIDFVIIIQSIKVQGMRSYLEAIKALIIKYYILNFYMESTEEIRTFLDDPATTNKYIKKNRVEEVKKIFNIAFGHLRKPQSTFDHLYEQKINVHVFINLWAIINEIINNEIKTVRGNNPPKKTYSANNFTKSTHQQTYRYFMETNSFGDLYFKGGDAYTAGDLDNLIKLCYSPKKPVYYDLVKDQKNDETNTRYSHIPPNFLRIILKNDRKTPEINLLEFQLLNESRDNLYITHGKLLSENISDSLISSIVSLYEDNLTLQCVRLFNFIYYIILGKFIYQDRLDSIFKLLKYYSKTSMYIRGKFKGIEVENKTSILFLIEYYDTVLTKNNEMVFSVTSDEMVKQIKSLNLNDDVDDYNGYTRIVNTPFSGIDSIKVQVAYIDTTAPYAISSSKTSCKQMKVTVTSPFISIPIILTYFFGYYN